MGRKVKKVLLTKSNIVRRTFLELNRKNDFNSNYYLAGVGISSGWGFSGIHSPDVGCPNVTGVVSLVNLRI